MYHDADTVEWREAKSPSIGGSAPINVQFKANPQNKEGWDDHYEWRFTRKGETKPYLIRYEEDTDFEFYESNEIKVTLYSRFTKDGEVNADSANQYTITAYESKLLFPNAFSPNGDDKNPKFQAKEHQSIIEFHAYIFNRWGQKLFEWTNPADGWDGTYNGKDAKEGVYFVLVKAKGADGRKFLIKKDVNLLRGFNENAQTSGH